MHETQQDANDMAVEHGEDTGHDLSGNHLEHMAALDLVDPANATHVAVQNGDWFDPATWENGQIPGDGAAVNIPQGVSITYAGENDASIFTIGVAGELRFGSSIDSKLVVDTLVVTPSGRLEIGTAESPVSGDVTVDIVIANNGQIDTSWDPQLLSRGIISLGDVEIHGSEVDAHLKVIADPMAGDTVLNLEEVPHGWKVGDTIEIAGTHNQLYSTHPQNGPNDFQGDTNEARKIISIDGNKVTLDRPLDYDHDSPREDLKTSVANFTRSITIRSEDGVNSEVHERGHVMFMGSDNVDVRFAAFDDLGRTDKSFRSVSALSQENDFDTNVQGRYGLHLHQLGVEEYDEPIVIEGIAISGSPGWGLSQHSSYANLHNNAVRDAWGASFVSEAGDEIGTWSDNISLGNVGFPTIERLHSEVNANDLARTGSGFWLQSRSVDVVENVAVGARTGFVWIVQGETAKLKTELTDHPDAFSKYNDETVRGHELPISLALNNEVFGSERALTATKGLGKQFHDIRTVIDGLTAWEVRDGIKAVYTAHYVWKNIDLIATTSDDPWRKPNDGILFSNNAFDMVVVDAKIQGFKNSYSFTDFFSPTLSQDQADKEFFVVGGQILDANGAPIETPDDWFEQDDYQLRTTLVALEDVNIRTPTVEITHPRIGEHNWKVEITGTRFDSLGQGDIATGPDSEFVSYGVIKAIMEEHGYFSKDGAYGVIVPRYYSDRLTGEIVKIGHWMEFDSNDRINKSPFYGAGDYKGELPENNAPVVPVEDSIQTAFRTSVVVDLLANDIDAEDADLRLEGFIQPPNGRVRDNGDGTATYTPDLGFSGIDRFEYWVTDGFGVYSKGVAIVTVTPLSSNGGGAGEDGATHGNDVITGSDGDDLIRGKDGDDQINGAGGDDEIAGGGGDDLLFGSAGDDILRGNSGEDLINGGGGDDQLYGGGGADVINGGDGDDLMLGVTGNDQLYGGAGDDNMFGRADHDVLDGGDGDDRLTGNQGDDVLRGARGRDLLLGGGGEDNMTGGGGRDVFIFQNERGQDVITDFEVGVDLINFAKRTFGSRDVTFLDLEFSQDGADAIIRDRGLEIRLEGVNASLLSHDDFIF